MSATTTHPAPTTRRVVGRWLTAPVITLLGATAVFGSLALAGVSPWDQWPVWLRWALAAMFLLTASARLGPARHALEAMVPPRLGHARVLVGLTGALEALGAVGLLIPSVASIAAWCLATLLVAMFPANVSAARRQQRMGRRPATPLPIRTLHQLLFLAVAVSCAW